MFINKAFFTSFLLLIALSVSVFCFAQDRKKSRIRPVIPYNHATLNAPPNMIYIRGGSTTIRYNQSSTDSNSTKKVSLTSFFIDKTEITNQQYRQFTEWVIDSIAVVKYLKDDKYFMGYSGKDDGSDSTTSSSPAPEPVSVVTTDTAAKAGDSTKTASDAKKPDNPKSNEVADKSSSSDATKPNDTTRRRIDWSRVNHKKLFDSKNQDVKGKLAPLLDENGEVRRDAYMFLYTYIKTSNTATNSKEKTKKYVSEVINVYPDEKVWAEDLTNSQTDLLVENYFKITPFDDYPVVGVTWRQARAFCYWRSLTATNYTNMPEFMKYYHLTYSLPTEAQWVYAASGYYDMLSSNQSDTVNAPEAANAIRDTNVAPITDSSFTPHDSAYAAAVTQAALAKNKGFKLTQVGGATDTGTASGPTITNTAIKDSTPIHKDNNGMLANFKQDEGDYWEDGSALTLPVMAFAPNEFGLYNMEGNVSEWVLDAYSPSTFSFVSDLNPALLYDADSNDVDAMRRKVVRGGSFMSNAKALSPYYRDLELDNVAHCYIGFRCILAAPEVLYTPVGTRKKKMVGPNTNRINQRHVKE